MASSAPASRSSIAAGRMRAAVMAEAAAAAVVESGKNAATVDGIAVGRGRSRTVARTMTPSVPSEPIMSAVRS